MEWQTIESAPDGITILTKIDDKDGERNVQPLRRSGNLFFTVDSSMYVYYRPTHWKQIEDSERIQMLNDIYGRKKAELDHWRAGAK